MKTGILVQLFGIASMACMSATAQQVLSPEVTADRHIIWRLDAPSADEVLVSGNDVPQLAPGRANWVYRHS